MVALPVSLYLASVYALYTRLTRAFDPFHGWLLAGTAVVVLTAAVLAPMGVPMVWCLLVLSLAPWVSVVGYEAVGYRHNAEVVAEP